ncbi:MAG TPA: endolytic transglycosylase MltG [Acidimicrobiales bacterium]|nr:endolytic transglycosylase MltG [Acidimicrobiales bacterium]
MTERDPFGAALSAGTHADRAPAANGEAANAEAANAESAHQLEDADELANLNGLTDDHLQDSPLEDDRLEGGWAPDDVETEGPPEGVVGPGEAGYYEDAAGYDQALETAEGDEVGYADGGEEVGYADGGEDGEYVDAGEGGGYVEDVEEAAGLRDGDDPAQYADDDAAYYGLEAADGDEISPEAAVLAGGVGATGPEAPIGSDGSDNRRPTRTGGESRRRQRRRRWTLAACVVAVAVVVVGVVGYVRVSHDINPGGRPGRAVTVAIPSGASTHKIAELLAGAGVIHGADVFELYTKLEGAGALLPGTYRLPTNEAYSSVLSTLENGPPPVTGKLVVPEGFTIRQIAAAVGRLQGIGISAQSFVQAATSGQVRSPYEPPGTNDLEGLLFPATYPVQKGETADYLVQYMVDTFDSYASQLGLTAAARELHYTPYQVVTVASIVEREAKFESDRGPIASAIYNRLSRHIPIGAESTLLYGLGDPNGPVNMDARNPYNTLIHVGLPPTPISNPGIPSLEAAMKPPTTNYIFWVEVNPDGKMGYASNEAGFVHLQAECKAAHLC